MSKKVAVVTGGARGIGRRIAAEFASDGYRVAVNFNRSADAAAEFLHELRAGGFEAESFKADVSKSSEVRDMMENIFRKFGRMDVVVNNAAVIRDRTVSKMSDDEWNEVISTDLSAVFYVTREAAKIFTRAGTGGSIVNISSIVGARGNAGEANYAAAKGGLISLSKSSAIELGSPGIRVNCVLPGFHLTDMGRAAPEAYYRKNAAESVLKMTTSVDELARFVVFISELKTVSGQVFNVDSRII